MNNKFRSNLSLLCLSACLVSAAQANEAVDLSFSELPEFVDMACQHPDLDANTREISYTIKNNGQKTVELGHATIQNHDAFADSLTTILQDGVNDCNGSLASGQSCEVRVQMTPPQCPMDPTENHYLPIIDEPVDRTLQVGPIEVPMQAKVTTLGVAGLFAALSGNGGIHNHQTTQVRGSVGVTQKGKVEDFGKLIVEQGLIFKRNSLLAQWAQADLTQAYQVLWSLPCVDIFANLGTDGDLPGVTPGVYCPKNQPNVNPKSLPNATVDGFFTLDANNINDALFVFKMTKEQALVTADACRGAESCAAVSSFAEVDLINGAKASNVFWLVEQNDVKFFDNTIFVGNVLAINKTKNGGTECNATQDSSHGGNICMVHTDNGATASLLGRALIMDHFSTHNDPHFGRITFHGNSVQIPNL